MRENSIYQPKEIEVQQVIEVLKLLLQTQEWPLYFDKWYDELVELGLLETHVHTQIQVPRKLINQRIKNGRKILKSDLTPLAKVLITHQIDLGELIKKNSRQLIGSGHLHL